MPELAPVVLAPAVEQGKATEDSPEQGARPWFQNKMNSFSVVAPLILASESPTTGPEANSTLGPAKMYTDLGAAVVRHLGLATSARWIQANRVPHQQLNGGEA